MYESLHIARSKASNCLLQTNPQSLNSVIIPSKLPGMTYTADEQCQILFGPTASFCQEMQVRMGVYQKIHLPAHFNVGDIFVHVFERKRTWHL